MRATGLQLKLPDSLRDKLQDIPGCEITVSDYSMSSMMTSSGDINLSVSGNDYDTLAMISDDLVQQISALPDAMEVQSSLDVAVPQVNIHINRESAARYGLTAATIGTAVRSELSGTTATTVTMGGQELDVVLRGDSAGAESLDALKSVSIPSATGGFVPLSLVADVEVELAPQSISRTNQSRTVTITGTSRSGDSIGIAQAVNEITAQYPLPEGYYFNTSSAADDIQESFTDLGKVLLIAVGLVYFILASQFESFLMPIIIMMILPDRIYRRPVWPPITGHAISMMSLVGLIMLAGVVVNSAIVLVDYINTRRKRGESKNTAILNACPAVSGRFS